MSVFSTNQVRHFYAVSAFKSKVASTDAVGTVAVDKSADDTSVFLQYVGADKTVMRSDLIDVDKVLSAKLTTAKSLERKLKAVTVKLSSDINAGEPVGGQDYILRISFRQYIGMSDEDLYFKYGIVHAVSGMSQTKFYKELAVSLAKNLSKELVPLLDVYLTTSSGKTPVLVKGKIATVADGAYTGILLVEAEQEWTRGIKEQVPVYFEVHTPSICVDGDEILWGTITSTDSGVVIPDGKKIADLEYFCMGERGDMYRNINWPNSIPTKYLVDLDAHPAYDVIDIHYFYTGENQSIQKSEKTITLAIPTDASEVTTSVKSALESAGIVFAETSN